MTQIAYESIPIQNTGEPLVNLADYGFVIEPAYFDQGISSDPIVRARSGIADKLLAIQNSFEGNYRFKIWDAHRPREVQAKLYDTLRAEIAEQRPELSGQELDHETQLFITKASDPGRIPPHATGGTVDLTLLDKQGHELTMGTAFDHFGPEAAPHYFEGEGMDTVIRDNRRLLIQAMTDAGFSVHDDEWWHFDYGNQAWAVRTGQPEALYGEAFLD